MLVVPDSLTELAIFSCHEGYDHGHQGFVRTFQTAFDKYYWVGMYAQIKQAVKECQVCNGSPKRSPGESIFGARPKGATVSIFRMAISPAPAPASPAQINFNFKINF